MARLTVSRVLVELCELEAASQQIERGLRIADTIGANRFKPFLMIFLARVQLAQNGRQKEIVELMENALQISRETNINENGVLVIVGTYLTNPKQFNFRQKYIYEGLSWKMIGYSAKVE
ncbi:MAG: hypothetical protein OES26_03785 [Gammaproteobacteria bacterium]|nr:hypothetical protein [Gammaproteobacteria bacterium]